MTLEDLQIDTDASAKPSSDGETKIAETEPKDFAAPHLKRQREATIGFLYCLGSTIGYTITNILLRAVAEVDPAWVSCVKAGPMVALILPWYFWNARAGEPWLPSTRFTFALIAVSLLANFGGNVLFQWSLGVIGVAMSTPLTLGAMIVSGAVLGRVFLREGVSVRSAISCLLLLTGIVALSLGARDAGAAVADSQAAWRVLFGVQAASFAGFSYATMGVVMRHGLQRRVSPVTTLAVISVVGLVTLSAWSFGNIGWQGILATTPRQWLWMILAGVANTAAFFCLTKALQHTTLLLVNSVNASQAAFCAVAGVLIFAEAFTLPLCAGLALTVVGLLVMKR